jgi:hypothetical protein
MPAKIWLAFFMDAAVAVTIDASEAFFESTKTHQAFQGNN